MLISNEIAERMRVNRTDRKDLVALIEDDRNYFRAGSKTIYGDGYSVHYLAGLAHSAAGCMVEFERVHHDGLIELAHDLTQIGATSVRAYFEGDISEPILERLNFQRTIENVLIIHPANNVQPFPPGIHVRPATKADDPTKVQLYREDSKRPDGKDASAEDIVRMERQKIESGYMSGFIVEHENAPVGCFGLSIDGALARMKNLMIKASARGIGGGSSIVRFAQHYAIENGCKAVGVFAIAGSAGERLYVKEGMRHLGTQTEYATPMEAFNLKMIDLEEGQSYAN